PHDKSAACQPSRSPCLAPFTSELHQASDASGKRPSAAVGLGNAVPAHIRTKHIGRPVHGDDS
ncbi:MAG TPA: hypothetical protein VGD16_01925, partial [Enterovirga sp.]